MPVHRYSEHRILTPKSNPHPKGCGLTQGVPPYNPAQKNEFKNGDDVN